MNKTAHTIYIGLMVLVVVLVTGYMSYTGYSYYQLPEEERFYHPQHDWFKPSGAYGHGIGILGTVLILFGVVLYIARKRYNFMSKQLRLKYLLEFHIFLCTLGPILILFHTAFKFGGLVSVAFWSMVAVVASGVIGRFIYIQIPRTIEGRELTLSEVKGLRSELVTLLKDRAHLDESIIALISGSDADGERLLPRSRRARNAAERDVLRRIRLYAREKKLAKQDRKWLLSTVKDEFAIAHRIDRLLLMQRLFKYWHVAHLPFALIMLIILIIHVAVTLAFGYRWIF